MSLLFFTKDDLPFLVDSDELPKFEDNKCAQRIFEIAVALEQKGFEGIRVQCIPIEGGRFLYSLNLLQGSWGEYILECFADYARKYKKIFSVEVALQIAKEIQEAEVRNE